jgi:hypothetical protein
MRGTRLMESHCDPRKFRFGFGFMKGAGLLADR